MNFIFEIFWTPGTRWPRFEEVIENPNPEPGTGVESGIQSFVVKLGCMEHGDDEMTSDIWHVTCDMW